MGTLKYQDLDKTLYRTPNIKEESQARQFNKLRQSYSELLARKVDDVLADAANELVEICMQYNIEGKNFTFTSNSEMESRVDEVLDDAMAEILALIEKYATTISDNDNNLMQILLAYLSLLGNKNRNMQETLSVYMQRFREDMEATIAAMKDADYSPVKAVTEVKSNLHDITGIPAVATAFKNPQGFQSQLIIDGGQHYDPDDHSKTRGVPTNGILAVLMMSRIALQMTWDRWQILDFQEKGAIGFYQMRGAGSTFPCQICDDACGLYLADTWDAHPAVHPNCQCIRIPIYSL